MNQVSIQFNKKSKVGFLGDNGRPEWYVCDVLGGEWLLFFEEVVRASTSKVYLRCYDGQIAFAFLDDISHIDCF
jgi:hypothetical protein